MIKTEKKTEFDGDNESGTRKKEARNAITTISANA